MTGKHDLAEEGLDAARETARRAEVLAERSVEIRVMESLFRLYRRKAYLADGDVMQASAELFEAQGAAEKALGRIERGRRERRESKKLTPGHQVLDPAHLPDPVLEGECYILLTQIAIHAGRSRDAERHLADWDKLSQFVENHYLHHLAKILREDIKKVKGPYELEYAFKVFEGVEVKTTLSEYMAQFERWLLNSVISRWPSELGAVTLQKLCAVYGKTANGRIAKRDAMSRLLDRHGLRTPRRRKR